MGLLWVLWTQSAFQEPHRGQFSFINNRIAGLLLLKNATDWVCVLREEGGDSRKMKIDQAWKLEEENICSREAGRSHGELWQLSTARHLGSLLLFHRMGCDRAKMPHHHRSYQAVHLDQPSEGLKQNSQAVLQTKAYFEKYFYFIFYVCESFTCVWAQTSAFLRWQRWQWVKEPSAKNHLDIVSASPRCDMKVWKHQLCTCG